MGRKYTPVMKENPDGWVGWIEEVPSIKCQAKTQSELTHKLFEALVKIADWNHEDKVKAAESWRSGQNR